MLVYSQVSYSRCVLLVLQVYFSIRKEYYQIARGNVNLKLQMLCKSVNDIPKGKKGKDNYFSLRKMIKKEISIEGPRRILKEGKCIVKSIIGWGIVGRNREMNMYMMLLGTGK